jgi:hypothetical protein
MSTKITDAQFRLARTFERAGLCSISQAIKAFERRNDTQIVLWKAELAKQHEAANDIDTNDPNFIAGRKVSDENAHQN